MKKVPFLSLLLIVITFSSCELAGDIFKAGAWTAIIGIVVVIALIFWIISKISGRR